MADSAPLSMVSGPLWLLKVCHNFILKSVSQFYLKCHVTILWLLKVCHNQTYEGLLKPLCPWVK